MPSLLPKKLGFSEFFKSTYKLSLRAFWKVLPLSLIESSVRGFFFAQGTPKKISEITALSLLHLVVVTLCVTVLTTFIYIVIDNIAYERNINPRQILMMGLQRLPKCLLFMLLFSGVTLIPMIFLLGPVLNSPNTMAQLVAICFLASFSAFFFVYSDIIFTLLVTVDLSISKAIDGAVSLVKNHWWYAFGGLFIMVAMGMLILITVAGSAVFLFSLKDADPTFLSGIAVASGLIGLVVGNVFVSALKASASILMLHQLKLRHTSDTFNHR